MPLEDLVELHGGQMLKSFAQGKYMQAKEYGEYLDAGVCSALSTTWITRRANGKDFFKYVDTVDGRNEVAMLQGREQGFGASVRASMSEGKKVVKEAQELQNSPLNKLIGFLPNAVLETSFVKNTIAEQNKRTDQLKQRADELKKTGQYLKTLEKNQHQYRADYIKDKTGLEGHNDRFTSADAPGAVSGNEGFVIFGMNGHGNRGHAVALYHGRDGVSVSSIRILGKPFSKTKRTSEVF